MLLEIEYNHEKEEFRKQTETMGVERKVRRGDAWFPVKIGSCYYNSLNQAVVEVTRTKDSDIEHNFEPGRPVCFFTVRRDEKTRKERIQYMSFTATVSYAEHDRIVVALPNSGRIADLQRSEPIGLQLFFDETSYRLMFEALDRVMNAKTGRLAALRDIFYTSAPAQKLTFGAMSLPWLNASQQQAVNEVLRAKDVAVVHGPPGTGKTTTLVEAIYETLRRESQVLVCAQSNMAVDWIAEKLVDRGVNVLRIGNPTRVNDKMLSFTYERRFEAHPDYPQLWSIRKAIRELRGERRRSDAWHQKMDRLKSRATEIELRIRASLFGEARVIACTLTGAANRVLEGEKFSTLFIDEAAQALEAACRSRHLRWRPLSAAAHREEHYGTKRRTRHHTHGAHREGEARRGDALEGAVSHERADNALLKRLVLRRRGADRARNRAPQHTRLRPSDDVGGYVGG